LWVARGVQIGTTSLQHVTALQCGGDLERLVRATRWRWVMALGD
jgi:hypothetical protein